jgi:YfiH family protein
MPGRSDVLQQVDLSPFGRGWITGASLAGVEDANLAHHRSHVPDRLAAARDRVGSLTETDPSTWHLMRQVHGAEAGVIDGTTPKGAEIRGVDVLVTDVPDRPLVVLVADCLPILAAGRRAVGVAHVGWRGVAADTPGALARALERLGERAEDAKIVMGPGIGPCCYEVGPEVIKAVGGDGRFVSRTRSGAVSVDLRAAVRARFLLLGVQDVSDAGASGSANSLCTACGSEWFSHRRDPSGGRQAGIVVLQDRRTSSGG